MADAAVRLNSLSELPRRLKYGWNTGTEEFVIFRLQLINRFLVQSERFNDTLAPDSFSVLLESVEQIARVQQAWQSLCYTSVKHSRNLHLRHQTKFHLSGFHLSAEKLLALHHAISLHNYLTKLAPLFIQLEVKPKPIGNRSHSFSRQLRVDWIVCVFCDWLDLERLLLVLVLRHSNENRSNNWVILL